MIEVQTKKTTGSYYTKPEIVSLILDLAGYDINKNLFKKSILEPSAGEGAFVLPIIRRLIQSLKNHIDSKSFKDEAFIFDLIKHSIYAIEIDKVTFLQLHSKVKKVLSDEGISTPLSQRLADSWLIQGDFLFWNKPVNNRFDFIVGNPPYIRIENWSIAKSKKYRKLYPTLFDRADIYIAFIEHGLEMLTNKGKLTYICTDRFTKNHYGKEIRHLINQNYYVVNFLDIHNAQPFTENVSAYPCIFTISRSAGADIRTLQMEKISSNNLEYAKEYLLKGYDINYCQHKHSIQTHTIDKWFKGNSPWILNGFRAKKILGKIENSHPLITDSCHQIDIGIGVATGLKRIYIIHPDEIDVEDEILLPVVTKDDIKKGYLDWCGHYVINPYKEDGSLVDLDLYPKLRRYLYLHKEKIMARNTARRNPNKWYKTIDRIYPERLYKQKILIPDIKSNQFMVIDDGQYYPEHSLYYLTAGNWDIKVLQALLMSSVVKFFIWSYATRMRGDYLRYQAQYLKKIRLPISLSKEDQNLLKLYYRHKDIDGINLVAQRVYGLTYSELNDIKDLVDN